jgi:probable rRNA maturation factor
VSTIEIIVGNNQEVVDIPESWLTFLEEWGTLALPIVLEHHVVCDHAPLPELGWVEVALVDDETSANVHEQFMEIPGATDVITFHHGEIVIGAEVAVRQAEEMGEPLLREIFRYLVHGLLHLAGHEDESAEDRARMEAAQETIVAQIWRDPA